MIFNNNYLADILRVCEIKDLIWVMRFQSPLVYFPKSEKQRCWSDYADAQACLRLCCSQTPEDSVSRDAAHFMYVIKVFRGSKCVVRLPDLSPIYEKQELEKNNDHLYLTTKLKKEQRSTTFSFFAILHLRSTEFLGIFQPPYTDPEGAP